MQVQDATEMLPIVLLFDTVTRDGTLVYKNKENPLEFWGFIPDGITGEYACVRCDYVGRHLKGTPIYTHTTAPLSAIEDPDPETAEARDFSMWLWTVGTPL